ncbi:hypothetical protein I7I53_09713 [Histoplasma capsulatum var. duboisii H88]|uniref:Uncharacterized protein n=1 Tax=Ajellomyces capsulatus (strain H88) TaxID=544711 RepID=A0A8A1L9M3_AJEC8|nr:hypothetical protein I7I53_09713 [Histoplasma capsulatum var. duboisii H88]
MFRRMHSTFAIDAREQSTHGSRIIVLSGRRNLLSFTRLSNSSRSDLGRKEMAPVSCWLLSRGNFRWSSLLCWKTHVAK